MVIEQGSTKGPHSFHRVFSLDVTQATNLLDRTDRTHSRPAAKTLVADLTALGYDFAEKVEGLTVVSPTTLAVLNDNDFGVASDDLRERSRARILTDAPSVLGLIHLSEPLTP